jgi:glycosidase
VAKQSQDPTSLLSFYQALVSLRQTEPALNVGDSQSVDLGLADVFAYIRSAPGATLFLIILNFAANTHTLDVSQVAQTATIAIATDMSRTGSLDVSNLRLHPNEGLVLHLS